MAKVVQEWTTRAGVEAAHIEKASPWENGRIESFRSKLRHELIDREIVYSLREASILIEASRIHDNMIRPHSVLGEQAPTPEVGIGTTSPLQRGAARLSRQPWRSPISCTNLEPIQPWVLVSAPLGIVPRP
ncbi:MAG: transposase [Pseudomonadota bacterium]|nr:transposase [Pseudomonadota bacterium]